MAVSYREISLLFFNVVDGFSQDSSLYIKKIIHNVVEGKLCLDIIKGSGLFLEYVELSLFPNKKKLN
jgi:hypothetical protein